MSNTSHSASAARYANALFQLAKEAKVLDSISSDLEKIKKFLLSDSDIASFIENPSVKNTNKLSVLNVASDKLELSKFCLLYTSPSPRDKRQSRMPSSA